VRPQIGCKGGSAAPVSGVTDGRLLPVCLAPYAERLQWPRVRSAVHPVRSSLSRLVVGRVQRSTCRAVLCSDSCSSPRSASVERASLTHPLACVSFVVPSSSVSVCLLLRAHPPASFQ
jgi:hypothetical protein